MAASGSAPGNHAPVGRVVPRMDRDRPDAAARHGDELAALHQGANTMLDPAEGMTGWPEFQTKDGKPHHGRAWCRARRALIAHGCTRRSTVDPQSVWDGHVCSCGYTAAVARHSFG